MRQLVARVCGEDGVALILAVLILAVVSVAAASAIFYTTAAQKDASSNKARQTAYTLAQGALSKAVAQLTSHYYDNSGQPDNNATVGDSSWAPSGSQCTSTSNCMTWATTLNTSGPFTGIQQAAWHITATGTVRNPSGSGNLSRTISIDLPVNAPPAKVGAPAIFRSVYSGQAPSSSCDMTIPQGTVFVSPVYVLGNLCVSQSAGAESPGTLVVGGWLDDGQKGHVGTTSSPLSSLTVAGSCDGSRTSTPCTLTYDAVKNYWANTNEKIYVTSQASNSATFPPVPSVDWTTIAQQSGVTSSGWSCTGGKDVTVATFDLGGTAYSCTEPSGSLAWDGTTLTVSGNFYVSGNLVTQNTTPFLYTGIGSIYVGGAAGVSFGNNSSICVGSTSNHACPSGPNWDASTNFLLILAKGPISGSNFNMEGGLYSDQNINFGSGQTGIDGPLVTPQQVIPGQQASSGFPNITTISSGAPDTTQPFYTLGTPTNATY